MKYNHKIQKVIRFCILIAAIFMATIGDAAQTRATGSEGTLKPTEITEDSQKREEWAGVPVPVIMYHDILRDPKRQGRFTVTPWELESDLRWLKEKGYESITVSDMVEYVYHGTKLPEKPIVLTFDDGHYNNLHYATTLLEQYGMRGVMFVVGAYSDKSEREGDRNPNYSYVTWDDLQRMEAGGIWEIQSHSYNMHEQGKRTGAGRRRGESEEDYRAALHQDIQKITKRIAKEIGHAPIAWAYPFGKITGIAEEVLREEGYQATFSCYEGITELRRGDPETLFQVKRGLRKSGRPVGEIVGWK